MKILVLSLLFFPLQALSAPEDDFVITVNTDIANDGSTQNTILTNPEYAYNYNVDCNDDGVDEAKALFENYTCDFSELGGPGIYTIRIKDNNGDGTGFPHIVSTDDNYTYAHKIISLDQWGTGKWLSMNNSFKYAYNMVVNTLDIPDLGKVKSLKGMFYAAKLANPDVSDWDVSNVTNMSEMFKEARIAKPNVSNWNVSSVTDLSWMFYGAFEADPDVEDWDVTKVQTMRLMFYWAKKVNPNVSKWDVSNVTDMSSMFSRAEIANPDVTNWDVANVENMQGMFSHAYAANPDVSNWDVSNVKLMGSMFSSASKADPYVTGWDVSKVKNMSFMFSRANAANPDFSNWDVSKVEDMQGMFSVNDEINPEVSNWDVSNVTNMVDMFNGAYAASPDMSNWQIINIGSMHNMFSGVTLPPRQYDQALINFRNQQPPNDVNFVGGNSNFCEAEDARAELVNTFGWDIEDGGINCGSDVSIEFSSYKESIQNQQKSIAEITVSNTGYQDVIGANLTTLFSSDYLFLYWTCTVLSGGSPCPFNNGTGNIDESVDLKIGDKLLYTFTFETFGLQDGQVLEASSNISLIGDIYQNDNQDNIATTVTQELFSNGFE